MKEKPKTFTNWWKHKRKYGKRVIAKINRKKAKAAIDNNKK